METNTTIDQLPTTIRAFLQAQEARDADTALALLTPGAVITDVGESFSGEDSLRRFVSEAGAEFTYTSTITKVVRDGATWVVGHHLEGNFPGGTADLDYRFALDGERVERLDIVAG
ncbi:nuclear transport factor 2 family protein [Desertihabitans brevis]|uniref:Nuclear transport factor 2 family protein n=1 Tax=Desertihabitans brevis TaxID=2268447 RepID=A0A367YZJ1_9ACTN|nr:nuclear transport factor 2 family protein [Desertihabitans brevis]RCK71280.1 nuclear transport factor 2 family protein [Desertihabitans brevis]